MSTTPQHTAGPHRPVGRGPLLWLPVLAASCSSTAVHCSQTRPCYYTTREHSMCFVNPLFSKVHAMVASQHTRPYHTMALCNKARCGVMRQHRSMWPPALLSSCPIIPLLCSVSSVPAPLHGTGASIKGAPTTYLLLLVSSQSIRSSPQPNTTHPRLTPSAPYNQPLSRKRALTRWVKAPPTLCHEPDNPLQQSPGLAGPCYKVCQVSHSPGGVGGHGSVSQRAHRLSSALLYTIAHSQLPNDGILKNSCCNISF